MTADDGRFYPKAEATRASEQKRIKCAFLPLLPEQEHEEAKHEDDNVQKEREGITGSPGSRYRRLPTLSPVCLGKVSVSAFRFSPVRNRKQSGAPLRGSI